VSRAHSAAKAYDFSVAEAAAAQAHAIGSQGAGTPAAHACDALRLEEAVHRLALRSPEFSASSGLWGWQKSILASLAIIFCAGTLLPAETSFVALLVLLAVPFLFVGALRAVALWHFFSPPVSERAAHTARLKDENLPIYTVLVPLFGEAAIVPDLICALRAIDYPERKLQVLLIVESIDHETQAALRAADLRPHMRVLIVPDGKPRTKPRACQYALQFATGAYIVVYDAEDWPDPAQLRGAIAVFRATSKRLGCLQAQLNIYNSNASWLTRQFTIEYTALFDCILPTLERLELPVPLGGTSNHFPRAVLDAVGGWDPFNVTEDADLGIRLARSGWHVGVLSSSTWEEAPSTFRVWLGQRTRWLKGWMQTYLVHMREPRRLWRELGARRFVGLQVLMGGLVLSALVHPWFYVFLALNLWHGQLSSMPESVLDRSLLLVGVFNLIAGYLSAIWLGAAACARRGQRWLSVHAVIMPLYWLAISLAAYRAIWQLASAPFYWEKTEHFARLASSVPGQSAPAKGV